MTTAPEPDNELPEEDRSQVLQIGQRLRTLRSDRGLSIHELAGRSGVSSGSVSQIERGQTNPSVGTLQKLGAVLGVTLWTFLEESQAESSDESTYIRRSNARPHIVVGPNQLTKELLSPRDNNDLRFMILKLPPESKTGEALSGPGDKGGYVLSGTVELTLGDKTFELREGDSFQFASTIPHQVSNTSLEDAKLIWIINIRQSHL